MRKKVLAQEKKKKEKETKVADLCFAKHMMHKALTEMEHRGQPVEHCRITEQPLLTK